MYKATTATRKIAALRKRIKAIAGGTSASKTISILLILIDRAQTDPTPKLTSVVSETMPHLKKGAERDFMDILKAHNYWNDARWNATDHVYTFETGSKIEFFSADSPDKVRGPRRDRLYVNEANNIAYLAYDQLEVRTRDDVWLDWNPTNEFWWYTEVAPNIDHDFVTVTYKDNEALDANTVQSIESRKGNKAWWQVYGLGQLGETEAQIYRNWQIIDEVPHEARLERYGLDFGYTNDPTAVVAIYAYNGGYIWDEIIYRKGMSNKQIADHLLNLQDQLVVADSAEPKSIDELKSFGLRVLPSVKGQGSVSRGIQHVQAQQISLTKRSTNIIKEYRNYLWLLDKLGRTTNEPEPGFDHAMDAGRYAMESLKPTANRRKAYHDPNYRH